MLNKNIPCPVCNNLSFYELDYPGSYLICSKCGWEDDDVQYYNPNFSGGANLLSLNQARLFYKNKVIKK